MPWRSDGSQTVRIIQASSFTPNTSIRQISWNASPMLRRSYLQHYCRHSIYSAWLCFQRFAEVLRTHRNQSAPCTAFNQRGHHGLHRMSWIDTRHVAQVGAVQRGRSRVQRKSSPVFILPELMAAFEDNQFRIPARSGTMLRRIWYSFGPGTCRGHAICADKIRPCLHRWRVVNAMHNMLLVYDGNENSNMEFKPFDGTCGCPDGWFGGP
jgi:hypothetical protein